MFHNANKTYEKALESSSFTEKLTYNQMNKTKMTEKQKRRQKEKLYGSIPLFLWMSKPMLKSYSLKFWEKSFPKTNPLSNILNKKTVKISYSCTRNMKSIISGHNKQVLQPKPKTNGWNSRDKNTCPFDNKFLTPKVIYQANVTNDTNGTNKHYLGFAETSFKDRYNNHIPSFCNDQQKKA